MEQIIKIIEGYNQEKHTLTIELKGIRPTYDVDKEKIKILQDRIKAIDEILKSLLPKP